MNDRRDNSAVWIAGCVLGVLLAALVLRYATNILDKDAVFDEKYIRVPIETLLASGWSVETAIDFKETKGPVLIWLYAIGGALLGGELNDLRLVSLLFFVTGAWPLLLIARSCGVRGPGLPLVTLFYVLLPHNATLGQILMSEPSFVCGALCLLWIFVWGFGDTPDTARPVLGPVLFGVVLAVLLHHRVHAVAFAGAAAMVAVERDRGRSWPWWVACVAAGLSRLPLWFRWGGLVHPDYQHLHGLGLSPASVTYLAAASVPLTVLLLWPALRGRPKPRLQWLIWAGAGVGLILALAARPGLGTDTIPFGDRQIQRYLGFIAAIDREMGSVPGVHLLLVGVLPVVGMASAGALAAIAWARPAADRLGVVMRLATWTPVVGCGMYALTRAVVYDRYLLPWAVLLPIVWVAALPRPALVMQALGLLAIGSWFAYRLLLRM